jgi:hypothetical protein
LSASNRRKNEKKHDPNKGVEGLKGRGVIERTKE